MSAAGVKLARRTAAQLREAHAASRRFYRLATGAMTAITALLVVLCFVGAAWLSLALVVGLFVPLWLFVAYRTWKLPGVEHVERVIASPACVKTVLKLVTKRTRLLGLELDSGELISLRFASERELDGVRAALAASAPEATQVPPLDQT